MWGNSDFVIILIFLLHHLSHSSSIPHNTMFSTLCISFRWLLPLNGSWVSVVGVLENKGTIVPLLGSDVEDESRLPQAEEKEEESYFQPWRSWNGDATHTVIYSRYVKHLRAQGQWHLRRSEMPNLTQLQCTCANSCFQDVRMNLNSHSV